MSISSPRPRGSSGMAAPHVEAEAVDYGREHAQLQHHAHGEPAAVKIADLRVGQPYELDRDARQAVADAEDAGNDARPPQRVEAMDRDIGHDQEHDALEQ